MSIGGNNSIGSATYDLSVDDSQLVAGLRRAESYTDNAGKSIGKLGAVGIGVFSGISQAVTNLGLNLVSKGFAQVSGSISETIGFGKQMNEVFTLLPDITSTGMEDMQGSVKAFAKEFGTLPNEVVPALYSAISAGVPKENVFDFLETAQKAAVGGVTDLGTAVDGISSVVNAYGADVLSAAQASDFMFTAVRLGKTDFSQLSESLFQVIPTASALGVGFGDVTAGLAALTAQGVPTSVATTQLRQLFVELSKEGGVAAKTFEDLSGKSFKEFISAGGNTADALDIMLQGAQDLDLGVNDLFGSVEAGSAALALAGSETFVNNIDEMAKSAGATDTAFARMETGIDRSIAKIRATMAVWRLEIGSRLLPVVASLLAFITAQVTPALGRFAGTISSVLNPALATIAGAFTPVQEAFNLGRDALTTFIQALQGDWESDERILGFHLVVGRIGTAFSDLLAPVIVAVAYVLRFADAVGELLSLGSGRFTTFDSFKALPQPLQSVALLVTRLARNFRDLLTILSPMGSILRAVISGFARGGLQGALAAIPGAVSNVVSAFENIGGILLDFVSDMGSQLLGVIEDTDWAGIAGNALGQVSGAVGAIDWGAIAGTAINALATGFDTVTNLGSRFLTYATGQFNAIDWGETSGTILNGIAGSFSTITDFGSRFLSYAAGQIDAISWTDVGTSITAAIASAIEAVTDFGSRFVSWAKEQIEAIEWSATAAVIIGKIVAAIGAITTFAAQFGSWAKSQIGSIEWGATAKSITDGIITGFNTVTDFGQRFVDWAIGQLGGVDWDSAATDIVDAITISIETIQDFGSRFYNWAKGQIEGVDWVAVGEGIGSSLSTGIEAGIDLSNAIEELNPFSDFFNNLGKGNVSLGLIAGGLTVLALTIAAIGPVVAAVTATLGLLAPLFATLSLGLSIFASGPLAATIWGLGALVAAINPVTLVIVALGALIIGFAVAWNQNWFGIRDATMPVINAIVGVLASLGSAILAGLQPVLVNLGSIFGELTAAFSSGSPLLTSIQQAFASLGPAIQHVLPILKAIGIVIGGAIVVAIGLLLSASSSLVSMYADALPGAIQVLTGVFEIIGGAIQTVSAVIIGAFQIIVALLQGDWAAAWEAAKDTFNTAIDGVLQILGGLGDVIVGLLSGAFGAVVGLVTGFVDTFIGFFQTIYDALVGNSIIPDLINGIIGWITELPTTVIGIVSGFVGAAIGLFTSLAGDVIGIIGGWVGSLLGFFSDLIATGTSMISGFVGSIIGFFIDLATEGAAKAGELVTGVLDFLLDLFIDGPLLVFDTYTAIIGFLANLVTDGIQKAVDFVTGIVTEIGHLITQAPAKIGEVKSAISTKFGEIIAGARQWGLDLVGGFIGGITEKIPDVGGAVDGVVGAVTGAMDFFKFGSPSKTAIQWGLDTFEGFIVGAEAKTPEVFDSVKRLTDGIKSAFDALSAGIDFSAKLGDFEDPDESVFARLVAFSKRVVDEIGNAATHFSEDGLKASNAFADSASKSIGLVSAAVAVITEMDDLRFDLDRVKNAASAIKETIQHITLSLGDSAGLVADTRPEGFLGAAEMFSTASESATGALIRGLEFVNELTNLRGIDLDAALASVSHLKEIIEHIALSIGDSAAFVADTRPEGFLGGSEVFSRAAETATASIIAGLAFLSELRNLQEFNLNDALNFVSGIKIVVEHIAQSIGDSARALIESRPEDFLANVQTFADAVTPAIGLMTETIGFMVEAGHLNQDFFQLDIIDLVVQLADVARFIAGEIVNVARTWSTEFNPQLETFAAEASQSTGVLTGVLDTLSALQGFDASVLTLDLIGLIQQLAEIARFIAGEVGMASMTWSDEVNPQLAALSIDVQNGFGILTGVLDFLSALSGGTLAIGVGAASTLATILVDIARTVALAVQEASATWSTEADPALQAFAEDAGAGLGLISGVADTIRSLMEMRGEDGKGRPLDVSKLVPQLVETIRVVISAISAVATEFEETGLAQLERFSVAAGSGLELMGNAIALVTAIADMSRLTPKHMDRFVANWELVIDGIERISVLIETRGLTVAQKTLEDVRAMAGALTEAMTLMNQISGDFLAGQGIGSPTITGSVSMTPAVASPGMINSGSGSGGGATLPTRNVTIPVQIGDEPIRTIIVDTMTERYTVQQ